MFFNLCNNYIFILHFLSKFQVKSGNQNKIKEKNRKKIKKKQNK